MDPEKTAEFSLVGLDLAKMNDNANEVLCWPYLGHVWAVLNKNQQVTHAKPKDIPTDSEYASQEEYAKAVIHELSRHGEVKAGIITETSGRFFFHALD